MGYIGQSDLERLAATMKGSEYGQYLMRVVQEG
jgi:hypothetical protein